MLGAGVALGAMRDSPRCLEWRQLGWTGWRMERLVKRVLGYRLVGGVSRWVKRH